MPDYQNIPLYANSEHAYVLVYFEDKKDWYIQYTNKRTGEQTYSADGYNTPRDAQLAWEGRVTYVAEAPGKS